jgi:hypothetical protein
MKLCIILLATLSTIINGAALVHSGLTLRQDVPKDAVIVITSFSLNGEGCPEKSSGSIKYIDGATLTIIFDKFAAYSFPAKTTSDIGCEITVNLVNRAAYKSGTLRDVIRGAATLKNTDMYLLIDTNWSWQSSTYDAVSGTTLRSIHLCILLTLQIAKLCYPIQRWL